MVCWTEVAVPIGKTRFVLHDRAARSFIESNFPEKIMNFFEMEQQSTL